MMIHKHRSIIWLTVLLLFVGATSVAASPETFNATGEVRMLSVKAKTLSLRMDEGTSFFSLPESTAYRQVKGLKNISVGDKISVEYTPGSNGNVARSVTMLIAELPPGATAITTRELESLVDLGPEKGNYLLVDTRSSAKYTMGHIRTAVSIPYADLAANPDRFLTVDRNRTLIFYCEGITCDLSTNSAAIALAAGYGKVRVYLEGEYGWRKTDYCIATSVDYLQKGNIILVDLRAPEEVKKGHLPRAVNIPLAKLEQAEDMFPAFKGAEIVFYGNGVEDVRAAIEIARDWEFRNVSAFPGGTNEWQAKGLRLEEGPTASEITYVRQYALHEMGAQEFKQVIKTGKYRIIDVRTKDEFARGHLENSLNIPLEELLNRQHEIPKDKPVLLHCSTGIRSEMAYQILVDKGYELRFLNATLDFGRDNKYVITE